MASQIQRIHPRLLSTGRPKLTYIPWKTKEEMLGLHEEDAARWNASTLSTRFSAPRENVNAILRLAAIRKDREKMLQTLEKDKRERIVKAREKAISAWSQLIESAQTGLTRQPSRPSKLEAPAAEISVPANAEDKGEEYGSSADPNREADAVGEPEVVEVGEAEGVKNSAWSEYVETEVDNFVPDVKRKTTYAFVEIGDEKETLRRAVWIREGSGKMRIANEAERRLLLNEERARDSTAWQS